MHEERYWFEYVPEKDRVWVLAHASEDPSVDDLDLTDPAQRKAAEVLQRQWASVYIPVGLEAVAQHSIASEGKNESPEGKKKFGPEFRRVINKAGRLYNCTKRRSYR